MQTLSQYCGGSCGDIYARYLHSDLQCVDISTYLGHRYTQISRVSMMAEDEVGEYSNGPDQVIPCNNLITWDPSSAVKIRMEK